MTSHAIGAYSHATRGMILASISAPYYRLTMDSGLKRLARFARAVWEIPAEGKTNGQLAKEGADALESWIKNVKPQGYRALESDDILKVLKESM